MDWISRRPLLAASLSGILVGLLVAGVWTVARPHGEGGGTRVVTQPAATVTTTSAALAASQAEIDAAVEELLAFIADVRGLSALEPVTVQLQEDESFLAGVLDNLDPDGELDGVGLTLQALGLVEVGTDLRAALEETLAGGVLGYYDPEANTLFVRGTALTPFVKMTLAHELVHAIQDQHFGLERLEELDGEAVAGFQGLIEGDAVSVQTAFVEQLPVDEQVRLLQEGAGFRALREGATEGATKETSEEKGAGGSGVAAVLEDIIGFPYIYGPEFIAALIERDKEGDYSEVDEAFTRPPVSSEQILHPDAYFARHDPLDPGAPEPRGEVVDDGQIGEFLLRVLLAGAVPEEDAVEAAEGWGGDAYATWREDGRLVFSARFLMDSGKDRDELAAALETWAGQHGAAAVMRESRAVIVEASVMVPA